jgi:phosphatidylserine/phosphatidylglycerophosphate/cardiolipin synthase-like enzyme
MDFLSQGTAMLKRYNQSTQGLVPGLLLNRTFAPSAGGTPLRTSLVRHNVETTYVVPGDWPKADGEAWFHDGMAPAAGSDVEYLIDGQQTFDAMLEAMETATKQGHYILLLGWSIDVNFTMAGGKSFLQIVEERAQLGVAVRVLLWENNMLGIGEAERALNALRTTKALDVTCYLDDNTKSPLPGYIPGLANVTVTFAGKKIPPLAETLAATAGHPGVHSLGSHHHKILIVYGDEGLIGFCGGVDLDKNRLGYLHDVHLRVLGGAAKELLKIAEQRWEYAKNDGVSPTPATIAGLSPANINVPRTSPYLARIMQTVGNPDIKGVPNTIWMAVDHALKHATRHIYVEDQYFWSLDLVDALVEASKRVRSITMVLCSATVGEEDGLGLRHRALQRLVELGKPGIQERIRIFERKPGMHEWVGCRSHFATEFRIVT